MSAPDVVWRSPSPVWFAQPRGLDAAGRRALRRPAILRFERDSFMEDYLGILEADPPRLGELLVDGDESWLVPPAAPSTAALLEPPPERRSIAARKVLRSRRIAARREARAAVAPAPPATTPPDPPKLFQPAHQRYYLVTASLVCRKPGLPDRTVNPGKSERTSFVVRRLLPKDLRSFAPAPDPYDWDDVYDEYAFVRTGGQAGWVRLDASSGLVRGEEEIPLFGSRYDDDDGKSRRVLGGVIPVANRETYMGAAKLDPGALTGEEDPAVASARTQQALRGLFQQKVIEPWRALIELVEAAGTATVGSRLDPPLNDPENDASTSPSDAAKGVTASVATASWYIILDFRAYLADYAPALLGAIDAGVAPSGGPELAMYDALAAIELPNPEASGSTSLRVALSEIGDEAQKLEAASQPYVVHYAALRGWPAKAYLLVDPADFVGTNLVTGLPEFDESKRTEYETTINGIVTAMEALAPQPPAGVTVPPPLEAMIQSAAPGEGWFVLRCVYACPNCGDLGPPKVSDPSIPFRMAPFFDPDAPGRPVRIHLPLDTTTAGLRKHAKNTAFVLPPALCGQMKALRKFSFGDLVRSVLPWPFHKSLDVSDVGMCGGGESGTVCSLSIPIVTICALIILIMIAKLLDQIFRWFPFLITCFELPGMRSKEA